MWMKGRLLANFSYQLFLIYLCMSIDSYPHPLSSSHSDFHFILVLSLFTILTVKNNVCRADGSCGANKRNEKCTRYVQNKL